MARTARQLRTGIFEQYGFLEKSCFHRVSMFAHIVGLFSSVLSKVFNQTKTLNSAERWQK